MGFQWHLYAFLMACEYSSVSWQPHIRKNSYLVHRYPVGLAFIPLHLTQGSMSGGGARGHNIEHLQKVEFLCESFLEVYILATSHQKAFILSFHSMISDPRVLARGGARGQNLEHFQNEVVNPYLDNHLSESIQTWTRDTM